MARYSPHSNLNHIYFFLDTSSQDAFTEAKDGAKPTSNGSSHTHERQNSRTSTSGSSGKESFSSASTSSSKEMNPLAQDFKPVAKSSHMHPLAQEFKPRAQHGPVVPEPTASQNYELRSTMDSGLGLFATAPIKRGTLIICEQPLLRIPQHAIHLVWGPYCRLSNQQKATFDALHSFVPEHLNLEDASRGYLIDWNDHSLDPEDIEEMVREQVRVMSIFSANNIHIPQSHQLGVYATASRLNHSCVPNVHHSYNPTLKKITVFAARDISPNEELLTTYLGGDGTYLIRSQRAEKLRASYGFTCHCTACSDPTGTSDGRRELMGYVACGLQQYNTGNQIQDPFVPGSDGAALNQAEDLLGMMLEEGLMTVELTKTYRIASMHALNVKDFTRALGYARKEAEVERNCMGTEIKDLRKLGAAAECWIEKVYRVVRAERGEKMEKRYRNAAKLERKKEKKAQDKFKNGMKQVASEGTNWSGVNGTKA